MHQWIAFLGAFLLFLVQPLLGKAVTPRFGGGAQVWMICLVYFQVMLLAGYAYAHGISSRLSRRGQVWLHAVVLAIGLVQLLSVWWVNGAPLLPSGMGVALGPGPLAWQLIRVSSLLLLALCGTAPLVQSWYSRDRSTGSPYRLYAASNIGSMLGLLIFPFVTERWFPTSLHAKAFAFGYAGFSLCMVYVGLKGGEQADSSVESQEPAEALGWGKPLLWLLASATGVVILMALTNFLTQELSALPLLWVLPLAVYLLTFILIFDSRLGLDRFLQAGWSAALSAGALTLAWWGARTQHRWALILGGVACVFFGCLSAHGFLYSERPGPKHLTRYYFFLSLGGVLGGLFVAFLAPLLYDRSYEVGLALIGVGLVALVWISRDVEQRNLRVLLPAVTLVVGGYGFYREASQSGAYFRDFFGVLRVQQIKSYRSLYHGRILHGIVNLEHPDQPLTYYGPNSALGRTFTVLRDRKPNLHVGGVGLGVGSLAAYGRAGDEFTFYEISPLVSRLSGRSNPIAFPVLKLCPAKVEEVLGDGRTALESELRQRGSRGFDLLLVDAFSGDAIPWHLLTVEAMKTYMDHLAPGGILVLHVSNVLPIHKVGITNAKALDLYGARVVNLTGLVATFEVPSSYLLLCRTPEPLRDPRIFAGTAGEGFGPRTFRDRSQTLPLLRSGRPWRDDQAALSDLLFEPW